MEETHMDNLPCFPGAFALKSRKNTNSIFVGTAPGNTGQFTDWADFYLKINLWLLDQLGIDNRHFEIVRRSPHEQLPARANVIFLGEGIVMAKLHGLIN